MGFPRQEYWSGLPFPTPGDLPNPGIKPRSPTLQADSILSESPGKPDLTIKMYKIYREVTHHKAVLTITIIKGTNSQEFETKEQSKETAKSEFLKASNR